MRAFLLSLSLCLVSLGCMHATHSSGSELSSAQVGQIKKGVTTRQQVVEMFGTPLHTQMMGDGRRMLMYNGIQSDTSMDGKQFIPIVGLFNNSNRYTTRTQSLQVILRKDDVVEDFEFSDQTSDTQTNSGMFGAKSTTETHTNP